MTSINATSTPSPSWPRAILPIYVLAILSTLQSSESLLGQKFNHGFYLRTSPIFCLASVISFYAHIAQYLWHKIRRQEVTFYDCIAHLAPAEPQVGALWMFRPQEGTWLQMAGSVLYSIISTNISSMFFFIYSQVEPKTSNWTEFWGGCFAFSTLHCGLPNTRETAERREAESIDPDQSLLSAGIPIQKLGLKRTWYLASLDKFLFGVACVAHVCLLVYLITMLWPSSGWLGWEFTAAPGKLVKSTKPLYLQMLRIIGNDFISVLLILEPLSHALASYKLRHTYSGFGFTTVGTIFSCVLHTAILWNFAYFYIDRRKIMDGCWTTLFVGLPVALWFTIMKQGEKHLDLTRKLLLRASPMKGIEEAMDGRACLYFVGSVYTFVLSVLYYALEYE